MSMCLSKLPNSKDIQNQKGFTLIELLIVIAVIGILAGILVMVLDIDQYRKQANDARRINDVLSIQTAIVDSIANEGISLVDTSTCTDCNSLDGSDSINGDGWVKFNNLSGRGLIDIIQNLPTDPVNEDPYIFYYYSDGIDFEINAVFESEKYQINARQDGGNDDTVYERGFNLNLH